MDIVSAPVTTEYPETTTTPNVSENSSLTRDNKMFSDLLKKKLYFFYFIIGVTVYTD